MSDLRRSPDFEAALRAGLARLAESAPVPDDAHLDALERRTAPRTAPPRDRRPLALVAALVLVITGIAVTLAVRDRDDTVRFDQVGGRIETTTTTTPTTTTSVGPVLSARPLLVTLDGTPPEGAEGSTLMNGVTDQATLAEVWTDAELADSGLPVIDFDDEVVIEIMMDDVGCPSPELVFRRGAGSVRAEAVEPATCAQEFTPPRPRTYFYALKWADTGRPFRLDVVQPGEPEAFGSIPVG